MSFLPAEVSFLELERDSRFAEIVALMISGICLEEEKDSAGDNSEERTSAKKPELLFGYQVHSWNGDVLLAEADEATTAHRLALPGNYEIFTPPPKSSSRTFAIG